jgi:hypothetical protein
VARTERKEPRASKAAAKPTDKAAAKAAAHKDGANKDTAQKGAAHKAAAHKAAAHKGAAPGDAEPASDDAREQVIADAARLVQWGRKWYELPELIARMADRPPLPVVRRILKENKSVIDRKTEGA